MGDHAQSFTSSFSEHQSTRVPSCRLRSYQEPPKAPTNYNSFLLSPQCSILYPPGHLLACCKSTARTGDQLRCIALTIPPQEVCRGIKLSLFMLWDQVSMPTCFLCSSRAFAALRVQEWSTRCLKISGKITQAHGREGQGRKVGFMGQNGKRV